MTRRFKAALAGLSSASLLAISAPANVSVPAGDCSGVLVMLGSMSLEQKALVLTSGHCIGQGSFNRQYLGHGEILVNKEVAGGVWIESSAGVGHLYEYRRLLLATMTGTDLAVFELESTYNDILRRTPGVRIYTVSRKAPAPGMKTTVISANRGRTFSCAVEREVPALKEGPWTFENFVRFEYSKTECRFFHGVSGSPVIETGSDEVVALAHTFYEGGRPCSLNNPCEVQPDGRTEVAPNVGHSYGSPTAILYTCYDSAKAQFDPALASCAITKK